MPAQLAFTVHGTPAPQGSKTRMAHGGMVEASERVRPWREAVRHAAETAAHAGEWTPPPAVAVLLVFTFRRPRAHFGTGRNALIRKANAPDQPTGRPDLDKLIRATLDALTDAGALTDDATVVSLYASKTYPGGHLDALDTPGATVVIRAKP